MLWASSGWSRLSGVAPAVIAARALRAVWSLMLPSNCDHTHCPWLNTAGIFENPRLWLTGRSRTAFKSVLNGWVRPGPTRLYSGSRPSAFARYGGSHPQYG